MSEHPASSFVFSVFLHAAVVVGIFLFTHFVRPAVRETPKVFEFVMGEGENFLATEAPQIIATPVKTAPSTPPPERPPAMEVVTPPPEKKPPTKAPTKAHEPTKAPEKTPPVKDVKAKEPPKQISFDEHKKQSKDKKAVPPPKEAPPPKIAKIRPGIVSSANKKDGAGGTAVKVDQIDPMIAYDALLRQKLKAALDKPLDVSDALVAEAVFMVGADGSLSRARVAKSSDNKEFDKAVLDAIARTRMPERPDHKSDEVRITFRMKDEGGN